MEPEGSLPHSREPATCPYPESHQSTPCLLSHFLKIYVNFFLPSTPRSSRWSLSPRFPKQSPVWTSAVPPILATCLAHLIFLNLITLTIFGEEYRSLSSSLFSFPHSHVTSYLLGPNTLLSALCSNTLSLRSSLSVNDQVSHPNKTASKIWFSIF